MEMNVRYAIDNAVKFFNDIEKKSESGNKEQIKQGD
jgi:hypothetical protein